MNRVVLIGRLTREPDSRYTQGEEPFMITTYTLAVDRARKKEGEAEADFVRCVALPQTGGFCRKIFPPGDESGRKRPDPDGELCESGGA